MRGPRKRRSIRLALTKRPDGVYDSKSFKTKKAAKRWLDQQINGGAVHSVTYRGHP